jgi:glycosyltransferase involved in cell wall biosynthesis
MENFKVSIICLAYNHKNFIRQTLDGFISQKTNFPFQAIVHDDTSTDGTAEIIKEYETKYPDIIKPVYQKENQWNKGKDFENEYIFPLVKGEYIAFCEGDDYWTDTRKLQTQVDFLDKNKNFSICFHPVKIVDEGTNKTAVFPRPKQRYYKKEFTFEDLKKAYIIQTCSAMYRWDAHLVAQLPSGILPRDYFWQLLFTQNGAKAGLIKRVMAVYRKHSGGAWAGTNEEEKFAEQAFSRIKFYKCMAENFYHGDASYIQKKVLPNLSKIINYWALTKNYALIDTISGMYPDYIEALKNTPQKFFTLRDKLNRAVKQRKQYAVAFVISAFIVLVLLAVLLFKVMKFS